MPQTPAEQMLYTIVKLTAFKGDEPQGTGTGFFYSIDVGGGHTSPWIVTNRHVVDGCDSIVAICHIADGKTPPGPSNQFVHCRIIFSPQEGLLGHPDPDVDLCGISTANLLKHGNAAGAPLYFINVAKKDIPSAEDWENFDALEEVTMVGCPNGIYDEVNNLPIFRRGTTASALSKKYNGKDMFVVDMACFPGSSGSPVFIYNREGFFDRKRNSFVLGASRFFFLGVLFAGPLINNSGQIVLGRPSQVEVATMMHLGYVLRSTTLLDFENRILEYHKPKSG